MAGKTIRELTIELDATTVELRKDLAKAQKQLSGFQKKISGIGKQFKQAFSIAAIAVVGKKIIDLGGEMSMLGKELEGVKAGFDKIEAPGLLEDMKKATHGTVTELELMKAAVQAKNFSLPVEKLGTMLEFVHRRARQSGESVDFLTKSLVTGLGRKSAMIIDNLGISTSQLNDQLKLTPDFTTAVATIMERDMRTSGQYIETAADITERWGADWENTKAQVGLFINKGIKLIAPVIEDLRKEMAAMFRQASKDLFNFINEWIILYNQSILFRSVITGLRSAFNIMWIAFKTTIKLMWESIKGFGKLLKFVLTPKNWGDDFQSGIAKLISDSFSAAKNDVKEAGNDLAQNFRDGVAQIEGRQKMLVWDDIFNTDTEREEAFNSGEKVGEDFAKGVKKKVMEVMGAFSLPSPRVEPFEADTASIKTAVDEMKQVGIDLSFVNNFISDSFSQLGENVGASLAGAGSLFDGFLNLLLDFGKQFGKILIAAGVASEALKKVGASGIGAIIAGTALIAAVSAAKSLIAKGPGFAGGGIMGGSSFTGDKVPARLNSREMVLNLPQQKQMFNQINNGTGGGKNMKLVARVAGSDLLFVLQEAQRQDANSF